MLGTSGTYVSGDATTGGVAVPDLLADPPTIPQSLVDYDAQLSAMTEVREDEPQTLPPVRGGNGWCIRWQSQ